MYKINYKLKAHASMIRPLKIITWKYRRIGKVQLINTKPVLLINTKYFQIFKKNIKLKKAKVNSLKKMKMILYELKMSLAF
jgi:hypothetical protein